MISADILLDKRRKSKGTAVVVYASAGEAEVALDTMGGTKLYGREVRLREDRTGLLEEESAEEKLSSDPRKSIYVGCVFLCYCNGAAYIHVLMLAVFCLSSPSNLNTNVTRAMLKTHMEAVGPVEKATILKGQFDESLGCGVVVYKHVSDATRALTELYNSVLNGRLMFVREDREVESGGNSTAASTGPEKGTCVLLGNMDKSTPAAGHAGSGKGKLEQSVRALMEAAGSIRRVQLGAQLVGKGRGKILVEFDTKAAAVKAAAELHGKEVGGKKITVQLYGN